MRQFIDLLENANLPFNLDEAFCTAVHRYLEEHLADWADDFPDMRAAIEQTWHVIEEGGVPDNGKIEVYRVELRPAQQIADKSYSSLGACWSWDVDGAQVCHHDNAYDAHGRDVQSVLFIAEVSLSDVDWVQTIAKNMVLKREREINIRDGATITIMGQMQPQARGYSMEQPYSIRVSNISEF